MGPPLPSMKPPPHGMKHCQRIWPGVLGDMKLNFSMLYAPSLGTQGEVPQAYLSNTPRLGIANVCATLQTAQELITETFLAAVSALPLRNCCTLTVPPWVPWTWLQ